MRIFRPTYASKTSDGTTGERRKLRRYWIETADTAGGRLYIPALTTPDASRALAHRIERLIAARAAGSELDADLSRFVDSLNLPTMARVRAKLAERGILGASAQPLPRHVLAHGRTLRARGATRKHYRLTLARCVRVLRGIGAKSWADVTAERVRAFIQARRIDKAKPWSTTTGNHHARAVKMLARWMHRSGRAGSDSLLGLAMFKPLPDERPKCSRRALTVDEARRLLTTTGAAPERFGMTGEARALLYRLAIETGLRAGELASLTRSSFDLDSDPATVRVEAGRTKNRKGAMIDLSAATAGKLGEHLQRLAPAARAFTMPHASHTAEMLRRDLTDAGVPYRDDSGLKLDFHSLRHTRAVWLLSHCGASPAEARELLRVSSLSLVDRYSRSLRVTRTVTGPDLDALPMAAVATMTGTSDTPLSIDRTAMEKPSVPPSVAPRILPDFAGLTTTTASAGIAAAGDGKTHGNAAFDATSIAGDNSELVPAGCQSGLMGRIANPLPSHKPPQNPRQYRTPARRPSVWPSAAPSQAGTKGTPPPAPAVTAPKPPHLTQDGPAASPPTQGGTDPDATALAGILAKLDASERRAVVAHVRALVAMSKAKRAALLTLTT